MAEARSVIQAYEAAGMRAAFSELGKALEAAAKVYESMGSNVSTPDFAKGAASHFKANQPPDLPFRPLSFLTVAYPSPPAQLTLTIGGERATIPIPPIYIGQDGADASMDALMREAAPGHRFAHTKGISQKLLAAISGLGRYGRNNVCYVKGLGSHCSLFAQYTDIPFEGPTHDPLGFMDECAGCVICMDGCPTGAITGNPVIDADLCINRYTYRLDPIPEDVPLSVFNALIGCWPCQALCPVNKALPMNEPETLELGEAETAEFLDYKAGLTPALEGRLRPFFRNDHLLSVAARNAALALGRYGPNKPGESGDRD
ncbi:MAG: hypothetical protein FWE70_02425 [Oscillospiraceae bacterium]|nr:hypothetical protein [Oscillospiraceae bacterium]